VRLLLFALIPLLACAPSLGDSEPATDDDDVTDDDDGLDFPEPIIELEPEALDFGGVEVGGSGEAELLVRNVGGDTLMIMDVIVADTDLLAVANAGEYEMLVLPSASTTITFAFTPQQLGPAESGVVIASNDRERPEVYVPCTGEGL